MQSDGVGGGVGSRFSRMYSLRKSKPACICHMWKHQSFIKQLKINLWTENTHLSPIYKSSSLFLESLK